MGYATGQHPYGFHFFCLQEPFFQKTPLLLGADAFIHLILEPAIEIFETERVPDEKNGDNPDKYRGDKGIYGSDYQQICVNTAPPDQAVDAVHDEGHYLG
jgi:hypothetical protein